MGWGFEEQGERAWTLIRPLATWPSVGLASALALAVVMASFNAVQRLLSQNAMLRGCDGRVGVGLGFHRRGTFSAVLRLEKSVT